MSTTTGYNIYTYFTEGKTCSWAIYVDDPKNGGNNNGNVDGKEIKLFQDIISHRYNYTYDFSKDNSAQEKEIANLSETLEADAAKHLYLESSLTQGAGLVGNNVSKELHAYTKNYAKTKAAIEKITTFPVQEKKYEVIKNFLLGYSIGDARNGFFEQLGHEYGENFTNGEIVNLLKAIMDALPEEKKYTDTYGKVHKIYEEYSSKPQDEAFKDSKFSAISRIFSLNTLDQLDDAIEKLYS